MSCSIEHWRSQLRSWEIKHAYLCIGANVFMPMPYRKLIIFTSQWLVFKEYLTNAFYIMCINFLQRLQWSRKKHNEFEWLRRMLCICDLISGNFIATSSSTNYTVVWIFGWLKRNNANEGRWYERLKKICWCS